MSVSGPIWVVISMGLRLWNPLNTGLSISIVFVSLVLVVIIIRLILLIVGMTNTYTTLHEMPSLA